MSMLFEILLLNIPIYCFQDKFLSMNTPKDFVTYGFFKVGDPRLYVSFSVRPSVRPSIAHHISGTVNHVITIFSTHV